MTMKEWDRLSSVLACIETRAAILRSSLGGLNDLVDLIEQRVPFDTRAFHELEKREAELLAIADRIAELRRRYELKPLQAAE
jgi:hypothetical protein